MNIDDRWIADARERMRKKAQNEATCFAISDMLKDAQEEVRRLREENERLRNDAERYRWLRSDASAYQAQTILNDQPDAIDAAIDAARCAKPEPTP
jgi:hypothetical protein